MNIGVVYRELDNLTLAKKFFTRAYSIYESNLGDEHPDTVIVKSFVDDCDPWPVQ